MRKCIKKFDKKYKDEDFLKMIKIAEECETNHITTIANWVGCSIETAHYRIDVLIKNGKVTKKATGYKNKFLYVVNSSVPIFL